MKHVLLALMAAAGMAATEISPAIRDVIASGRFAEARRQCLEVTARDGSDVDHWICAARMSAWLGDYAAAVSGYDTALSEYPNNPEAMTGKALVLIWQKQFVLAEALLEQMQSVVPPGVEMELAFAQLERARGRTRAARVHARRAVALEQTNIDAQTLLQALEKSAPVVLQFGVTRDIYSFTTPGMLSSVAVNYQGEKNAVSLLMEDGNRFGQRNTRGGADYSLRFGNRWTAHTQILVGPGGDVYPSLDMKAGVAARLDGRWVAGVEYRRLTFANSDVQVLSPSIEYYWKKHPVWAQATWNESRSTYKQQTAKNGTFAAQINGQVSRWVLARAGFATGDENFINWDLGQIGDIREKSIFGGVEYRLTRRYTTGFSYGFAARSNSLTQETCSVKLIVRL